MFKQTMAALLHAGLWVAHASVYPFGHPSNCFSCMGIVIPITPLPLPTPFPIGPIAIDPPIIIDPFPFPTQPYPAGCPTHTINHSCPAMTLHCGPQPDCILLKTVTRPCHCPLPMPTVAAPCPTCQTGCGTIVRTVTAVCTGIVPTPTAVWMRKMMRHVGGVWVCLSIWGCWKWWNLAVGRFLPMSWLFKPHICSTQWAWENVIRLMCSTTDLCDKVVHRATAAISIGAVSITMMPT